jgi:hypothetical protein
MVLSWQHLEREDLMPGKRVAASKAFVTNSDSSCFLVIVFIFYLFLSI